MQFEPNETQAMLQESVSRFTQKSYSADASGPHGHSDQVWQFFCDQGWLAAGISEELGGLGGSAFDSCLIAQELGRALVREAFVSFAATAEILAALDPKGNHLSKLIWGETRLLLAHSEVQQRGQAGLVRTRAAEGSDRLHVSGSKHAILGGPSADSFLITARIGDDEGLSVLLIPRSASGFAVTDYRTIDGRGASNVAMDNVRVEQSAILGERGQAGPALQKAINLALVGSSAEAVGTMATSLELTRAYLNTRKQFGKLIGEFQALQHRLADMFIEHEMARSIVLRAIEAIRAEAPSDAMRLASACKSRAGKAGHFVGGNAIQLHGGIGVTEEYAVGHCYKRLVAFDLHLGSGGSHLSHFAFAGGRGER